MTLRVNGKYQTKALAKKKVKVWKVNEDGKPKQ